MEAITTADVSALSTEQVQSLTTSDVAALTAADVSVLMGVNVVRAGRKSRVRTQVTVDKVNPVTADVIKQTEVDEQDVDALPTKVTLAAPYAFYDDENVLHSWGEGRVVEDPSEIALLVERGAIFKAD